jgi:hypothetical protein
VAFPALVEVAFLRIVTHPRIFQTPSSLEEALDFLRTRNRSPRSSSPERRQELSRL